MSWLLSPNWDLTRCSLIVDEQGYMIFYSVYNISWLKPCIGWRKRWTRRTHWSWRNRWSLKEVLMDGERMCWGSLEVDPSRSDMEGSPEKYWRQSTMTLSCLSSASWRQSRGTGSCARTKICSKDSPKTLVSAGSCSILLPSSTVKQYYWSILFEISNDPNEGR